MADELPVLAHLPELGRGLLMTVELTILATLLSWLAGMLGLFAQLSRFWPFRLLGRMYVSLMRGTPSLVQLFVIFFSLPLVGLGGMPLLAAVLALGLNSGAYLSEILRANYRVVSTGQIEAAQALGLSPGRIWLRIRLPQMLRASLPALLNEFTILLKTTPLASVVAVTELTFAGQLISARTFEATPVLLLVAAGYLLIALPVIAVGRRLERQLAAQSGPGGRS